MQVAEKKEKKAVVDNLYLFALKDGEAVAVLKFPPGVYGNAPEIQTYDVSHGKCECQGFKFRGRCKHLDMLNALFVQQVSVSLDSARDAVAKIGKIFEPVIKSFSVDDYVRDKEGKVLSVMVTVIYGRDEEVQCRQYLGLVDGVKIKVTVRNR